MSDIPMKQEDHPAHNMPDATEQYNGASSKTMPDFSGKVTGRNAPENNWEDQRSMDNWTRNSYDIGAAGSYRK